MKCPYNRKTSKTVRQSKIVDELTEEVWVEEYELMECSKENCGVYHNGRCAFYQEG